jgi:hypothetical protein
MFRRLFAPLFALALIVMLGLTARGSFMQTNSGTPTSGTPAICATPVSEASGTPVKVVEAPTTAASPGGAEPGEAIGVYPCGTPANQGAICATPVSEASGTPVEVVQAPTTAASPGGAEPGEAIGIYECGTPAATPTS